jgi:2-isopropylmalate synthase
MTDSNGRARDGESRRISVFDSTLRDGEQAPGNSMRPEEKLALALSLESLGVDTVEAGFPSSSPNDFRAIQLISQSLSTAKLATLNRADRADISLAAEAGGVVNHQLQVMATGSDVHLEHKRGISRAQGMREIVDSVKFARSLGFTDITLGVEDATRGSDELLRPLIEAAIENGATTVAIADTTGRMYPEEFGGLISRVRSWIPATVVLSTHCHDDMGLSLANALAGIQAGADEIQTTISGIGERSGNTALEELAAVLTYKSQEIGATTQIKTEGLYDTFRLLSDIIGMPAQRNKAIFGANAFATQAGIHQAGMLRNPITYEYVEPEQFGRAREILIGRQSGRNVIRYLLRQLDRAQDEALLKELYEQYVVGQSDGQCIELDDLHDLIRERVAAQSPAHAEKVR